MLRCADRGSLVGFLGAVGACSCTLGAAVRSALAGRGSSGMLIAGMSGKILKLKANQIRRDLASAPIKNDLASARAGVS